MHPTGRVTTTASLILAATALSACGGDAKADALTRAEFTEQANALCAGANRAIGGVIGPLFGSGAPSPDDMQTALDEVIATSRQLADDIDDLAGPSDIADAVDELLTAMRSANDEAAGQPGAEFFAGDDDPWAGSAAVAVELGLDACAGE